MRFTALQDPCGQWMVYDLGSGFPAQIADMSIPGMSLLGLTREEAERLARQANESLLTSGVGDASFSIFLSFIDILPIRAGTTGHDREFRCAE